MPKLLHIDVSPRGDSSVSHKLGNAVLDAWKAKNPTGEIVSRNLTHRPLPVVDLPWIAAAHSTPDQHTPEQKAAIEISDELVDELFAADEILIATPMYNFAAPAALKSWIDHIVRFGRTFNAKYEGLVRGKKVSIVLAAGGDYAPGSYMEKANHFSDYVTFVFGFIGITDVTIYPAYGTSQVALGKVALTDYLAEHKPKAITALVG
jgi:FMN-dependent NADH-azoreductase